MVDYEEVHTKKGKTLVFMDLKEFLIDYYGDSNIESRVSGEEYIVHCPFCKKEGHTKHKLYIKDDFTVGHCFVCTRNYIGVTEQLADEVFEVTLPDFVTNFGLRKIFKVTPLTDPEWSLDKFEYECDDYDEKGITYLKGRHQYMEDLYKILGFKFLDGNVVMPFYYRGQIFYYQVRFSGKSKIKYFFPPIQNKPPYIIENGNNKKLIIVEGIFDAIAMLIQAPEYTPVAVLGSSISDYQIEFIREYIPEKIVVYMDETEISKRIANKIKQSIDYCDFSIIRSNGEDPEECLQRRIRRGLSLSWVK